MIVYIVVGGLIPGGIIPGGIIIAPPGIGGGGTLGRMGSRAPGGNLTLELATGKPAGGGGNIVPGGKGGGGGRIAPGGFGAPGNAGSAFPALNAAAKKNKKTKIK